MSITEKNVKKYEDRRRASLKNLVWSLSSRINVTIDAIKNNEEIDVDLPDAANTFNNKLNEIQQIFKKHGISMYVTAKDNNIVPNFVGNAIIEDLIHNTVNSTIYLQAYDEDLHEATQKLKARQKNAKNMNPLKRKFLELLKNVLQYDFEYLDSFLPNESSELEYDLLRYKQIDEKIWQYNLNDDLKYSIIKYIKASERSNSDSINGLLEKKIEPTLQALGLDYIIPKIKEELINNDEPKCKKQSFRESILTTSDNISKNNETLSKDNGDTYAKDEDEQKE